jgi:hypothetical protein
VVKINYQYEIPSFGVKERFARAALQGWQVSGIVTMISGSPLGVSYGTATAVDTTGTPSQGARVVVTGNPVLPKDERTFYRYFRTDVFQAPAIGTFGNAAKSVLRGPGLNNWDIAIFKTFPIHETVRLQFRCEMYNAWNHTQFTGIDTTTRFDATGKQTNARFGQVISAADPRQMQLALRLYF